MSHHHMYYVTSSHVKCVLSHHLPRAFWRSHCLCVTSSFVRVSRHHEFKTYSSDGQTTDRASRECVHHIITSHHHIICHIITHTRQRQQIEVVAPGLLSCVCVCVRVCVCVCVCVPGGGVSALEGRVLAQVAVVKVSHIGVAEVRVRQVCTCE